MNYIVAILIEMQFTEEEAFWILTNLIETIIPLDYYSSLMGI